MMDLLIDNSGIAALIAFALVLIPAVIVHELGHFFAGKSVGITILEFGIGFPPRVGRLFVWRGTEFTLNWLPLGGFVRPLGEDMVRPVDEEDSNLDRREAEERGVRDIKSVNEATPWQRILFLSAGAIANLVSAYILFVIIGMMGVALGSGLNIIYVDENSVLAEIGLQEGDIIERINGDYFITDTDLFTVIADATADTPVELQVLRGSEQEPVTLTFTPESAVSLGSVNGYVRIMGVVNEAPAGEAGIEPGDLVTTFNGQTVTSVQQLIELTQANLGNVVRLELLRGSEIIETSLTPREDPPPGEGAMGIQINSAAGYDELGVIYQLLPQQVLAQLSFRDAIQYGTDRFTNLFIAIGSIPGDLIQGNLTAAETRPVSIVGISQVGAVELQRSIEQERPVIILNYIALISIALGLTNLLPLPALDGGRILFVFIEIIRGRPIPPEREGIVHLLGLVFLLSLTVLVVINDIINPITDLLP